MVSELARAVTSMCVHRLCEPAASRERHVCIRRINYLYRALCTSALIIPFFAMELGSHVPTKQKVLSADRRRRSVMILLRAGRHQILHDTFLPPLLHFVIDVHLPLFPAPYPQTGSLGPSHIDYSVDRRPGDFIVAKSGPEGCCTRV